MVDTPDMHALRVAGAFSLQLGDARRSHGAASHKSEFESMETPLENTDWRGTLGTGRMRKDERMTQETGGSQY